MGVGYSAKKDGNTLDMALGYSHKVLFPVPESITFEVEQDPK
jgi:ribosomal protein L6P/L9E